MQYVLPKAITFDTTNATDEALSEWVTGTTYSPGDEVKVAADEKKYKNSYAVDTQSDITPGDDPTNWVSAPLNSVAMLDDSNSTATTNATTIDVTYQASNVDRLAVLNVVGTQVEVTVYDNTGAVQVFNEVRSLTIEDLGDFGDYLYEEQELATEAIFSVPDYFDVEIDVVITATGTAECGYLINGRARELGTTLYNGTSGLRTTGTRERNIWGSVQFTEGTKFNTMDLPVHILSGQVDTVKNRLNKLLDVPCLYIGDESDNYTSLTLYGFFFDLELPITRVQSIYTLRIEGLL